MPIIGIDLGTSNSLAAVWRNGSAELVPNNSGSFLTPSAVSLDEDGGLLVGQSARERLITAPDVSATGFKRVIGTGSSCLLGAKVFMPEELSSFVLRKLKGDAEAFTGEKIEEAVISVPAYFNDRQRAATKKAGLMAGLKVDRLINEPSAAALACRLVNSKTDFTAMVFDFGGGTLDVSIVDCFDTVISVLAVSGDNQLGGRDFDLCLAKAFCEKNNIAFDALSSASRADLLLRAESVKKELSERENAVLSISGTPYSGVLELNRQRLVNISAHLFQRMAVPVRRALADSQMRMDDIEHVVLVGGSCRMPVVREFLHQLLHRDIDLPFSPDTIVALGAGMCAGMRERRDEVRDWVMTDICPFSLGTGVRHEGEGGLLFSPIIERNSSLPCRETKRYYTTSDYQKSVAIDVYQGEEMLCKDNLLIGELHVPVPPAPSGKESVDVSFTYDIDGILIVDVTVTSTGEHFSRVFSEESGYTEKELRGRMDELAAIRMGEDDALRALREKTRRLYSQCFGRDRELIASHAERFERCVRGAGLSVMKRELQRMEKWLGEMERYIAGWGRLPSDFYEFEDGAGMNEGNADESSGHSDPLQ